MAIEIRPASAEELGQLGLLTSYVYGGSFGDGPDNLPAQSQRPEWTLCAFDGGTMVSSYSTLPFTMRANGNAASLGGVSVVGTLPEYRRRGLVRKITTQAFADMRERGQGLAALWASQAAIYQRYQYAQATVLRTYSIDTVDIAFHDGDAGSGNVARTTVADGFDTLRDIYRQFIADRMCYLHRSRALWSNNTLSETDADGPVETAICRDADGTATGYVVYTLRSGRLQHGSRNQEIKIRDFAWLTSDAYRSLWSFIARHDLVGRVVWDSAPSDDPAMEHFREPRLLDTRDQEGIWLRIVDLEPALTSRAYDVNDRLIFEVAEDSLTPWNSGTYELEVSPEGAKLSKSSANAELTLSLKALASMYSGYRRARDLAGWGYLSGDTAAVRRADAIFATRHAPHCPDHF